MRKSKCQALEAASYITFTVQSSKHGFMHIHEFSPHFLYSNTVQHALSQLAGSPTQLAGLLINQNNFFIDSLISQTNLSNPLFRLLFQVSQSLSQQSQHFSHICQSYRLSMSYETPHKGSSLFKRSDPKTEKQFIVCLLTTLSTVCFLPSILLGGLERIFPKEIMLFINSRWELKAGER